MCAIIDTSLRAEINAHASVKGIRGPTKTETILEVIAWAGKLSPRSWNRLEAELFGGRTLDSTIATLASKYGIQFHSEWETAPNRFGGKARLKRYSIPASEIKKARLVLQQFIAQRLNRQR